MKNFEYHNPGSISAACKLLKKYKGKAYLLAGGTDLIPKMYHRQLAADHVINIKSIPGLKSISYNKKGSLILGPLVNFNEIIYSELVNKFHPILVEVSKKIASHQIRNLATVGGNLCNAAPSADSAPILIALDTQVTITGPTGSERVVALEKLFTGPGQTELGQGEMLTKIIIPTLKSNTGMAYIKQTTRQALEIAIVGIAGLIQLDNKKNKCISCRVVIGACAPTPLRIQSAEERLIGKKITEKILLQASIEASNTVQPITDIRGSDSYRREMVRVQCKRVLELAFAHAKMDKDDEDNYNDNNHDEDKDMDDNGKGD
jgi:carbon-monoxide dehydrogenase medium subunit